MADANLFPDEAGFSPRPAWQVIEAVRRRYLTGELTLPTTPATRIYLRDGLIYFAERSSDGTLPIRLMVEGVITREQMQGATVIVNGVEHVGRMFDTDPSIDRASVELCVELFTDDVMISVANEVVASYELTLYRRHPSGIDRWYPHSVPVTGRKEVVQQQWATTVAASDVAATATDKAAAEAKPEPVAQASNGHRPEPQRSEVRRREAPGPDVGRAEVQPAAKAAARAAAEPEVRAEQASESAQEPDPQQTQERRNNLNAPPITQAVPVTASAAGTVPPPPITQAVATISPISTPMPLAKMPPPTAQIPVTVSEASSAEVDAAVIADEVSEAIKRAFAGMGSGY